jgi:hypothetical protein
MKQTTRDQLWVVLRPILQGIAAGLVYLAIRPALNTYIAGDEGAMTSGTSAFFGMLYAVVGGFSVFEVLRQWNEVKGAYDSHNHQKYLENVEKRLPWHLKVAWWGTSAMIVTAMMLTYWQHSLTAFFTIASVVGIESFWWLVAMDLDDPHTGFWNIPIPPADWWEIKKEG